MAFIKTTLTDDVTGKKSDFCFNTEYIISMQVAHNATFLKFTNGEKVAVDIHYEDLIRYVGAKDKLD
jgi:hypothetical protein